MAVALYTLIALAVVTTSVSASVCVEKTEGIVTGTRVSVQVEVLPGGKNHYDVPIDVSCNINDSGMRVKVCVVDGEPAPTLDLPAFGVASVTRYGLTNWHDAVLVATVYCRFGYVPHVPQNPQVAYWRR